MPFISRSSPKASKQKRRRDSCAISAATKCRDFSSTACCRATVSKRCCLGPSAPAARAAQGRPKPTVVTHARRKVSCEPKARETFRRLVETHFAQERAEILSTDVVRECFIVFLLASLM